MSMDAASPPSPASLRSCSLVSMIISASVRGAWYLHAWADYQCEDLLLGVIWIAHPGCVGSKGAVESVIAIDGIGGQLVRCSSE